MCLFFLRKDRGGTLKIIKKSTTKTKSKTKK